MLTALSLKLLHLQTTNRTSNIPQISGYLATYDRSPKNQYFSRYRPKRVRNLGQIRFFWNNFWTGCPNFIYRIPLESSCPELSIDMRYVRIGSKTKELRSIDTLKRDVLPRHILHCIFWPKSYRLVFFVMKPIHILKALGPGIPEHILVHL